MTSILDDDLREHIRNVQSGKPSSYTPAPEAEPKQQPTKPLPSSKHNVVITAELVDETTKAYNLKVYLEPKSYAFKFPFRASVYMWFPKFSTTKLKSPYWEVNKVILIKNSPKALDYTRNSLLNKYNFTHDEIRSLTKLNFLGVE